MIKILVTFWDKEKRDVIKYEKWEIADEDLDRFLNILREIGEEQKGEKL